MADALIAAALWNNHVALVEQLIKGGLDVDGVDEGGGTALYWAVREGFVGCAKVLLEANADVNKADREGWAPLHFASHKGHVECVKLLIVWKANVNTKAQNGESPLHWAVGEGQLVCIEILIGAGAEVDARDQSGHTPLASAIINNKPDAAELLLDKGAKMSNVPVWGGIPDWMNAIVTKRQNVKRGLLTFIGVLRKRFAVAGAGTEHIRGRLPRDVVGVLSKWVWVTRFDKRWALAELPASKKKR